MHERERLQDFRGGMVACRGCKRLLNFAPDQLVALVCCGILYRPEPGPLDLVIYDRVQEGEWADALVLPPPHPVIVEATQEDVQRYVTLPDPEMDPLDEEEEYGEAEPSDTEVDAMLATTEEIQERYEERQKEIRRGMQPVIKHRGPSYG